MQKSETTGSISIGALSGRLLDAARLAETIADKSLGKVRLLFLLGVLSALWLTYVMGKAFSFGLWPTLILFSVVILPAAMMGWLYFSLRSAQGLPQRINGLLVKLQSRAGEFRQLPETPHPQDTGSGRLSGLLQLGRMIAEVSSLSGEAREITAAFAGVVMITNPLFIFFLFLAGGATLVLITAALISGIFHVF